MISGILVTIGALLSNCLSRNSQKCYHSMQICLFTRKKVPWVPMDFMGPMSMIICLMEMKILITSLYSQLIFESRQIQYENIEFFGILIEKEKSIDGQRTFYVHQPEYISKLRTIPKGSALEPFRSAGNAFSWLSHTRSDICLIVNRASIVTAETFGKKPVDDLNTSIGDVKDTK